MFTDSLPEIGIAGQMRKQQDIPLPPKTSTRLHVSAMTPHVPTDPGVRAKLPRVRYASVEYHVIPGKRLRRRYDLAEAVVSDDEKNLEVVQAYL